MGFVEDQLENQRRVYKVDPPSLSGNARARFVWDNVGAAKEELSEIRRCYDAKVYTGLDCSGITKTSKQDVAEELCDLLCFLSNIASVEGITTEDLLNTFDYKLRQNAKRHARD